MSNPHGLFIWVDVALPDPGAAAGFYGPVLGWEVAVASPEPSAYWYFKRGENVACGMGKLSEEQQTRGIPPMWTSYIKVDDCEGIVAKAEELGGTILVPPMQILTSGKMAYLQDPTGAGFAVWESGDFDGADQFNDPGFLTWNELATRDVAAATAFYTALFGWETSTMDADMGPYTMFKVGERENGGMYDASTVLPEQVPSHWTVYFTVEDCDATVAAVQANGGTVVNGPFDTGVGRMAAVVDAQGAHFMLIQPAQQA